MLGLACFDGFEDIGVAVVRARLLAVPKDELTVLDDEIDCSRAGDANSHEQS